MTEPKQTKVSASIEVGVDPDTAFRIFTEEVDSWWERGPYNFYDGSRAIGKRFETKLGGRYLESYETSGEGLEIGRITLWEPGRRFVWRSSLDDTEVETVFDSTPSGTRLSVEQRLVEGGAKATFYSGWHSIIGWFADWTTSPHFPKRAKDYGRITPVLYYADAVRARDWLVRVFGLTRRSRDGRELVMGDSIVSIEEFEGERTPEAGARHSLYVYVDDLEGHFAQARDGGARIVQPIKAHGDRNYSALDLEGNNWTFAQARPTMRL